MCVWLRWHQMRTVSMLLGADDAVRVARALMQKTKLGQLPHHLLQHLLAATDTKTQVCSKLSCVCFMALPYLMTARHCSKCTALSSWLAWLRLDSRLYCGNPLSSVCMLILVLAERMYICCSRFGPLGQPEPECLSRHPPSGRRL